LAWRLDDHGKSWLEIESKENSTAKLNRSNSKKKASPKEDFKHQQQARGGGHEAANIGLMQINFKGSEKKYSFAQNPCFIRPALHL
jgi:hypothetical protein